MNESFEDFVQAFEVDWNRFKELAEKGNRSRADHMIQFMIYLGTESWNLASHMSEVEDFMQYDNRNAMTIEGKLLK